MSFDNLFDDDTDFIKIQKEKLQKEEEEKRKRNEDEERKKKDEERKKDDEKKENKIEKTTEKPKSEDIESKKPKKKEEKPINNENEKILDRLKLIEEKITLINNMQFEPEQVWEKLKNHTGLLRNYILRGQNPTTTKNCPRQSAVDQMTIIFNKLIREYLLNKKEENITINPPANNP
jgi:hypothetical protein